MKRAQVSLQFHWIFIIIAGAIILGFFIGIAIKQKGVSEKGLAIEVMEKFNEIFAGAGASESTSIKIDIPNVEIEFSCISNVSQYTIRGADASTDTSYDLIFAPDLLKGKSITTWTLAWKMPFNVQNFLMVTSPDVRYVIVYAEGSEKTAMAIMNSTPDTITKEMYKAGGLDSIIDKKNYRTRFIFIGASPRLPPDFAGIGDEEVSAVEVYPDRYVKFYKKQGKRFDDSRPYPADSFDIIKGEPIMVYAAMFSADAEMYGCNMAKAYLRMGYIAGIYRERAEVLEQKYKEFEDLESSFCSIYYTTKGFDVLENAPRRGPDEISAAAEQIRETNMKLESSNCPKIY